ncbi:MAG: Imm32 family immunity protein [Anaerolineae bacterium]
MLLTVEHNKREDSIEVFMDKEGLDFLSKRLETLRKHGGHEHLMTPTWAGNELTEDKQGKNNDLIHHLRLILQPIANE